ncbi:transposable element Tc1 transposase [Trichonephila clavipes]|nr:transposable element Tc1 transposase [Trichonephila clavipes]
MPRRGIGAHYEQLSEFERGRIIELKEGVWENRRIARHMGRSDAPIIRLFNDESRFLLCPDDNRGRVWRRPGHRVDPVFTIARHNGPQPREHLASLIFQKDNVRPHTVRVAMNCLTACQTLPWSARSPDLSPVEHV